MTRHLEALRSALAADTGHGAFLIGPYGAGKSHFLAYLTQELQHGGSFARPPDVRALSMLNYPATTRLEDAVAGALDIEPAGDDRRIHWARCLARHPGGLLLVIDELSEFLRSKPDRRQFSEDIRFLQFLGELGQDHRLFVIAAVQEAIEQIGDFDRAYYRKIKDRFPLVLRLGMTHVRDLIAHGVLVKRPGYAEGVQDIARRVRQALPDAPIDLGALSAIYPIHPATLELLEEVRYRAHLDELFETPALRRLAEAVLRLLVLVHLSPARDAMSAADATYWLLMSVARVDPFAVDGYQ